MNPVKKYTRVLLVPLECSKIRTLLLIFMHAVLPLTLAPHTCELVSHGL